MLESKKQFNVNTRVQLDKSGADISFSECGVIIDGDCGYFFSERFFIER